MNLKKAKTAIEAILKANLEQNADKDYARNIVPYLVSVPGLGKSSIIEQICDENDWDLDVLVAATMDVVDLGGMPMLNEETNVYERSTPFFLYRKDTTRVRVLFLDELPQSPTSNLNAIAQLANERRISEHFVDDNTVIVCAGNPMSSKAGTVPLPSHLRDRLTFIEVEPEIDTFLEYANSKKLDHRILGFLRRMPQMLSQFDPTLDSCPSPRSWLRVDTILKMGMVSYLEQEVVKGQVGAGAQADFINYLKVADKMPDIDGILMGTVNDVPDDAGVLYATCAALAAKVTSKSARHFVSYLQSIPNAEYGAFTIRDAVHNVTKPVSYTHLTLPTICSV